MSAKTVPVDSFDLVIFGGTGDLALRKLLPGLLRRYADGQIPQDSRIIGVARDPQTGADYRTRVGEALEKVASDDPLLRARIPAFLQLLDYRPLDATKDEGWDEFGALLTQTGPDRIRVFYLSTSPSLFVDLCTRLRDAGLNDGNARVVLEKPIGKDSASAAAINDAVGAVFSEHQIFRIDHYLGKETVQNLLALRFANILFEPLWNANRIDHVQITVAETVGLEKRAGYYDTSGALRDMVQNHLLQLLCLIAMDPPSDLSADAIRDEKVKVLKALAPITGDALSTRVVRGQYIAGYSDGKPVPGYLEEDNANAQSDTETFVALRADIRNWRWSGVPFYLRTGKRMPQKLSQIVIHFKETPHYIFAPEQRLQVGNKLIIRLQPDEGISLRVMTKEQGLDKGMQLRSGPLQLNFSDTWRSARIPDAYERLLLEVMRGNQNLFVRKDEIEYAWKWCDQLIAGWRNAGDAPKPYAAGSWGPMSSIALITRDGRAWYGDI